MLIPREDFLKLIGTDQQVARQFIKLLTKNVVIHEDKLINRAENSVRKRGAKGWREVLQKYRTNSTEIPPLSISREDLAQVVGTATESLIRTLSEFKSDKLIDIQSGKILILQESKLKNLIY